MSSREIPDAVRRVFTTTFTARHIAEPLASFDEGTASATVAAVLRKRGFDVAGVRRDGQIAGFVEVGLLEDGSCGEFQRDFGDAVVLEDTDPLLRVLLALKNSPFCFVSILGQVNGIITLADVEKPAVRMWLFGILTLIESRFTEMIEHHCPGGTWKAHLSEARLQKAQMLQEERNRRQLQVELIQCLQFSDKGQIIARNEDLRKGTVFSSRRHAEEVCKNLERLRNNLAHSQDIQTTDWETILALCEFVARERPESE